MKAGEHCNEARDNTTRYGTASQRTPFFNAVASIDMPCWASVVFIKKAYEYLLRGFGMSLTGIPTAPEHGIVNCMLDGAGTVGARALGNMKNWSGG